MGEVSAEYADVTVITDDNPRYEASMDIIRDIETGVLNLELSEEGVLTDNEALSVCEEKLMESE